MILVEMISRLNWGRTILEKATDVKFLKLYKEIKDPLRRRLYSLSHFFSVHPELQFGENVLGNDTFSVYRYQGKDPRRLLRILFSSSIFHVVQEYRYLPKRIVRSKIGNPHV